MEKFLNGFQIRVRSRFKFCLKEVMGFTGASEGKECACNAGDPGLILSWEDPLEKEMATPPVFLPGESHGQRSLAGQSPWGPKESEN